MPGWLRVNTDPFEERAINEEDYDWSEVKFRIHPHERVEDFKQHFRSQWEASGICPNPRMYEVVNSKWLSSMDLSENVKHYLIIGEVMSAEILCESWIWEAGEINRLE